MFYDEAIIYKDYLPERLQDYVEINALDKVINIQMGRLMEYVGAVVNNKSIAHADASGVARWEKLLGVSSPLNATLSARKDALKARLMTKPPVNLRTLKSIVEAYMGIEVDATVEGYVVRIRYRGESRIADLRPLYATVYETIPANMLMDIAYVWVTWGEVCAAYPTWGDMRSKTWEQVRKEM